MAYLPPEKQDYIDRFKSLQQTLNSSGHQSIGDWLFSEIAEIYNTPSFKSKLNLCNSKLPTIETNSKTLNTTKLKPKLFVNGLKTWLKKHYAKNAHTSYLFLPNEINQRISLMEIFKNFDEDNSELLGQEEFVDMFINNYIGNLHSQKESEINLKVLLDLTSTFKAENFTKGPMIEIEGVCGNVEKKRKPTKNKRSTSTSQFDFTNSKREIAYKKSSNRNIMYKNTDQEKHTNKKLSNFAKNVTEKGLNKIHTEKSDQNNQENSMISPINETLISEKNLIQSDDENSLGVNSKFKYENSPEKGQNLITKNTRTATYNTASPRDFSVGNRAKDPPVLTRGFLTSMKTSKVANSYKNAQKQHLDELNEIKYSEEEIKKIKIYLKSKFKEFFIKNDGSLKMNLKQFIKQALSEESNNQFSLLMRKINQDFQQIGIINELNNDDFVPFSFGKMVSFLSYKHKRHSLFIKFLSAKNWNLALKDSQGLFEFKLEKTIDQKQTIKGKPITTKYIQKLIELAEKEDPTSKKFSEVASKHSDSNVLDSDERELDVILKEKQKLKQNNEKFDDAISNHSSEIDMVEEMHFLQQLKDQFGELPNVEIKNQETILTEVSKVIKQEKSVFEKTFEYRGDLLGHGNEYEKKKRYEFKLRTDKNFCKVEKYLDKLQRTPSERSEHYSNDEFENQEDAEEEIVDNHKLELEAELFLLDDESEDHLIPKGFNLDGKAEENEQKVDDDIKEKNSLDMKSNENNSQKSKTNKPISLNSKVQEYDVNLPDIADANKIDSQLEKLKIDNLKNTQSNSEYPKNEYMAVNQLENFIKTEYIHEMKNTLGLDWKTIFTDEEQLLNHFLGFRETVKPLVHNTDLNKDTIENDSQTADLEIPIQDESESENCCSDKIENIKAKPLDSLTVLKIDLNKKTKKIVRESLDQMKQVFKVINLENLEGPEERIFDFNKIEKATSEDDMEAKKVAERLYRKNRYNSVGVISQQHNLKIINSSKSLIKSYLKGKYQHDLQNTIKDEKNFDIPIRKHSTIISVPADLNIESKELSKHANISNHQQSSKNLNDSKDIESKIMNPRDCHLKTIPSISNQEKDVLQYIAEQKKGVLHNEIEDSIFVNNQTVDHQSNKIDTTNHATQPYVDENDIIFESDKKSNGVILNSGKCYQKKITRSLMKLLDSEFHQEISSNLIPTKSNKKLNLGNDNYRDKIMESSGKKAKYKLGSIYSQDYQTIDRIGSQVADHALEKHASSKRLQLFRDIYDMNKPVRFVKTSAQKNHQLFLEKGINEEESSHAIEQSRLFAAENQDANVKPKQSDLISEIQIKHTQTNDNTFTEDINSLRTLEKVIGKNTENSKEDQRLGSQNMVREENRIGSNSINKADEKSTLMLKKYKICNRSMDIPYAKLISANSDLYHPAFTKSIKMESKDNENHLYQSNMDINETLKDNTANKLELRKIRRYSSVNETIQKDLQNNQKIENIQNLSIQKKAKKQLIHEAKYGSIPEKAIRQSIIDEKNELLMLHQKKKFDKGSVFNSTLYNENSKFEKELPKDEKSLILQKRNLSMNDVSIKQSLIKSMVRLSSNVSDTQAHQLEKSNSYLTKENTDTKKRKDTMILPNFYSNDKYSTRKSYKNSYDKTFSKEENNNSFSQNQGYFHSSSNNNKVKYQNNSQQNQNNFQNLPSFNSFMTKKKQRPYLLSKIDQENTHATNFNSLDKTKESSDQISHVNNTNLISVQDHLTGEQKNATNLRNQMRDSIVNSSMQLECLNSNLFSPEKKIFVPNFGKKINNSHNSIDKNEYLKGKTANSENKPALQKSEILNMASLDASNKKNRIENGVMGSKVQSVIQKIQTDESNSRPGSEVKLNNLGSSANQIQRKGTQTKKTIDRIK